MMILLNLKTDMYINPPIATCCFIGNSLNCHFVSSLFFRVAAEATFIHKYYLLWEFLYLPSNSSASEVLHLECDDLPKIKVEEVDSSVSSVDVSWLL